MIVLSQRDFFDIRCFIEPNGEIHKIDTYTHGEWVVKHLDYLINEKHIDLDREQIKYINLLNLRNYFIDKSGWARLTNDNKILYCSCKELDKNFYIKILQKLFNENKIYPVKTVLFLNTDDESILHTTLEKFMKIEA